MPTTNGITSSDSSQSVSSEESSTTGGISKVIKMTDDRSLDERISGKVSITAAVFGLVLVVLYGVDVVNEEIVLLSGLTILAVATGADQYVRKINR